MTQFRHLPSFTPQGEDSLVSIVSGPVIIQDGKVLLDKHEDDFWKFPGGSVISDESFEETAIREVREELNINVELIGDPYVINLVKERENKQEFIILIHYLAQIVNGEPKSGRDVTEFAWHDVDNLPADCAPNIKLAVKHFNHITKSI